MDTDLAFLQQEVLEVTLDCIKNLAQVDHAALFFDGGQFCAQSFLATLEFLAAVFTQT